MMAKVTKAIVDKDLRDAVFTGILEGDEIFISKMTKINDRQMGVLLTDLNGEQRYVRIGAIVAEIRDDMTAEELMQSEIEAYELKQAEKAEKAAKRKTKAEKDKAKREAEKAKAEEEDDPNQFLPGEVTY
jgi:DNA-directed RNA polymerase delta subunit